LLEILIGQLVPAAQYALVCVGFVIVYKSTKVLNFAQGQFVLVGGYIAFTLAEFFGGEPVLTIAVATAIGAIIGPLIYLLVLRPLLEAGTLVLVMLTLAISIILDSACGMIWGYQTRYISLNISNATIRLPGHVTLSTVGAATIVVAVVVLGGLALGLRRSRFGLATRAAAENPGLASYRGVNVVGLAAATWGFAMASATLAAISFSMQEGLSSGNADALGFVAFPAILVGGLDSIGGALVGALVLAEIQGLGVRYVGANFGSAVGYLLLLAFLVVRPTGIFGSRDILRV
jgi:branched-chain amino acid transport system permease protein